MEYLPKDPALLVSGVNMLLRDEEFDGLESLCYAFSREPQELKDYLLGHGFVWSEHQDLYQFLRSMREVDARLPECPDVEDKWEQIAEAWN